MRSDCTDHGLSGNKPGGYHQRRIAGRLYYVHRLAYAAAQGIPIEEVPSLLRHTCDNPRCVNPQHLIPGTHQDNANDRVSRGRNAKTLPGQWVLTEAQQAEVAHRHSLKTSRYCKLHGVTKLAKDFNVSTQAIYKAIERTAHTHV